MSEFLQRILDELRAGDESTLNERAAAKAEENLAALREEVSGLEARLNEKSNELTALEEEVKALHPQVEEVAPEAQGEPAVEEVEA